MHPIAQNPNAHSPTNSAGDNNSTATSCKAPKMAIREFFFSFLSKADRKRTDQGWNAAKRRFDGFIRFVSTAPAKIRGDLSEANKSLLNAAKRNDVEEVKRQIEAQAELNHADTNGMTAIMYAAQNGNVEMIRALTANGAAVNMRNKEGKTPMLLAVEKGRVNSMECLIEMGADIECRDNDGLTPLMYAVRYDKPKSTKFLLENGASAASQDKHGWNALMLAAFYNPQLTVLILNAPPHDPAKTHKLRVDSLVKAAFEKEYAVFNAIITASQHNLCNFKLPELPHLIFSLGTALSHNLETKYLPKEDIYHALALAGLKLTQQEWINDYSEWEDAELIHKMLVAKSESSNAPIYAANNFANDRHVAVDHFFDHPEPDVSRGNPLGLRKQGELDFATASRSVNSDEKWRHPVGKLLSISPQHRLSFPLPRLLLTGWRSIIAKLVYDAREDAVKAESELKALLTKPGIRIELVDRDGNSVPMDDCRLDYTLFSFALERTQRLTELAKTLQKEQPTNRRNKKFPKPKEKDRVATQAQAKAILELNKTYKRLSVRITPLPSSTSRANPVKDPVTAVSKTNAAASLPQVDGSLLDADQLLVDLEALDSDLARHWLISQINKLPQKTHPQALRL